MTRQTIDDDDEQAPLYRNFDEMAAAYRAQLVAERARAHQRVDRWLDVVALRLEQDLARMYRDLNEIPQH